MVRLYLNQIRKDRLLGTDSNRYVKGWLERHGIEVFHDGNKSYVNQSDFEIAYEKPMISVLKEKYGKNWEKYYQYYTTGNTHELRVMDEETKSPSYVQKYFHSMNPASDAGKDFIRKLQR